MKGDMRGQRKRKGPGFTPSPSQQSRSKAMRASTMGDCSDTDWEDCIEHDFEKVLETVMQRTHDAMKKAGVQVTNATERSESGGGEERASGGTDSGGAVSGLTTHMLSAIMSGVATAFMQLTANMFEKFQEKQKRKACECNERKVSDLESKIDLLRYENDRLEQYSRRENIRVLNLSEPAGTETKEELEAGVAEVCSQTGIAVTAIDFAACHRVGKRKTEKPRHVLVRFVNRRIRDAVIRGRRHLKGKDGFDGIYINEDLTLHRSKLMHLIKKNGFDVWSINGKLHCAKTLPPGRNTPEDRRARHVTVVESPEGLFELEIDP